MPKAGDYLVSGTPLAPSGRAVSVQQSTVSLTAGRTSLNIDFAGELIGANGDGVYSLTGLTVTEVNNPANTDRIHTVLTPHLLSARWTGGTPNAITLIEMWQAAQAGDAISPFGFYVSEANRLERLSGYLTRGDGAKAALELDKFIAQVGGSANVEAQWKQRIVGYARALRNTM